MSVAATERPASLPVTASSRLLVTVREPESRQYRPVGFLSEADGEFGFAYLRREVARAGFRPLPGLARAVEQPVFSTDLFPLFAERVVSARRPDREVTMTALGLPADAAPFEVLARSHGQRVGDTVELLPAPVAHAGEAVAFSFLSHGVRHLQPEQQSRIGELVSGERLHLSRQRNNPVNPDALLVTDAGDLPVGWVPDPLIRVLDSMRDLQLSVERANGPEVGYHFRLLIRLNATAEHDLFSGEDWSLAGDDTIPG